MNKTILEKLNHLLDSTNDKDVIKQSRTKLWEELGKSLPNEIIKKIKISRDNKLSKIRYDSQWWNTQIQLNSDYTSKQKKQKSDGFYQLYALNSPILDEKQFREALSRKSKQGRIILGRTPIDDTNYIVIMTKYFDNYRHQFSDIYHKVSSSDVVVDLSNTLRDKFQVLDSKTTILLIYDYLSKWFEYETTPLFINEYNYEFILTKVKEIELYLTTLAILEEI